MKHPVIYGLFAATALLFVIFGSTFLIDPSTTSSLRGAISDMDTANHRLAVACYNVGYELGRMSAYVKVLQDQGRGSEVPQRDLDMLAQGATEDCKP